MNVVCVCVCVCVCVWSKGCVSGVADHWSAKLETMSRRELKANIYGALICVGSGELSAGVSAPPAEPRNTEGAPVVIRQAAVD